MKEALLFVFWLNEFKVCNTIPDPATCAPPKIVVVVSKWPAAVELKGIYLFKNRARLKNNFWQLAAAVPREREDHLHLHLAGTSRAVFILVIREGPALALLSCRYRCCWCWCWCWCDCNLRDRKINYLVAHFFPLLPFFCAPACSGACATPIWPADTALAAVALNRAA